MEVSSKLLREIEFRDRLRGYDTDEVDEFLERVAVGIDELHAQLAEARSAHPETAAAPATVATPIAEPKSEALPPIDDDAIRRTLVLAQRTADMAIAEAKEEAARLLSDATSESERLRTEAAEHAASLSSAAEVDLHQRVERLSAERDALDAEIRSLTSLVEAERARIIDSLHALLSSVDGVRVSDSFANIADRAPVAPPPEPEPAAFEPEVADAPESTDPIPPTFLEVEPDPELDDTSEPKLTFDDRLGPPRAERGFQFAEVDATDEVEVISNEDDALWDRWASSGTDPQPDGDDPFRFGEQK
jgi:DivIVA domain-containing protein